MNIKIKDLPLRGDMFTLGKAVSNADENNAEDQELFRWLHIALENQLLDGKNIRDSDSLEMEYLEELKNFEKFCKKRDINVNKFLKRGLIKKVGAKYMLTRKSIVIFEEAVEIKKQLDEEGFHYCPCNMCY